MKIDIFLKMTYALLLFISIAFPQTWKDDSLVIRQILDTNGLDSVTVENVVWNKDSSGRVTTLWFNDLPALHILPTSIIKLNRLSVLTIEKTGLSDLPKEIGDIESLQNLVLKYNKLTSLVSEIGNLPLLNTLAINHEPGLQTLPPDIGKLSSLKILRTPYNNLSKIPDEICNLESLETLAMNNNKLTTLPDNFGNLKALKSARFEVNCLKSLPESFGNLTALQYANLENNNLKSLPNSITNLSLRQSDFIVCYNDSLVFTEEQKTWYQVKDYQDYFSKYCFMEIEQKSDTKLPNGILSGIAFKANCIHFTLRRTSYLKCRIYDLRGRMIEQVFSGTLKAGDQSIALSTDRCEAGIFYVVIQTGLECYKKAIIRVK